MNVSFLDIAAAKLARNPAVNLDMTMERRYVYDERPCPQFH